MQTKLRLQVSSFLLFVQCLPNQGSGHPGAPSQVVLVSKSKAHCMITHAKVGDRKFRKEIPGKDGTEMGGSRELQWCPCLCLKSSSHGGLPSFQYLGHLWAVSKAGHLCTSSPGAEGESTHFLLLYHQGLSPETTACSTITLLP